MKKCTKYIIALVAIIWLVFIAHTIYKVIDERKPKDEAPHIYHLIDDEYNKVFVYPTFKDEHQYIKYLFDFANNQDKSLMVINDKDDYITNDVPYFFDRNSTYKDPYFYFNKCDSSKINYIWITLLLDVHKIKFEKSHMSNSKDIGLKLKVESDSLNRNIMQNFVSYRVYDSTAEKVNKTYIYELYSQSDSLWAKKTYYDYGKYFSIDVY